jgi:hypothetical protein
VSFFILSNSSFNDHCIIRSYVAPMLTRSLILGMGWDWVHLVREPLIGLLYQPRMIDDEYGAVCGMMIGRGNRSTRRKPATVQLRPPQIAHDLIWDRTRTTPVGSRWLTARPHAAVNIRFVVSCRPLDTFLWPEPEGLEKQIMRCVVGGFFLIV